MSKTFDGVSQLKKAAKHRMDDAEALFRESRWRGSMYMAGYSIECRLKAKLMDMFGCLNLGELEVELQNRGILALKATIYSHNLLTLLRLTGSRERMSLDEPLWDQFILVNSWIPGWRYSSDLSHVAEASEFLGAVKDVSRWIENNV